MNDEQNQNVAVAEECDWLDVSYSERNYVDEETQPQKQTKSKFKLPKMFKIAAIAILCVAAFAALLFIDGNFGTEVFKTAKTVYSSSAVDFAPKQNVSQRKVEIPCNVQLKTVEGGVATFGGGKVALCFADGIVTDVTENEVVVKLDEQTAVKYQKLTKVFVKVGDEVKANALLGKYDADFTVSVLNGGSVVTEVVGSSVELTWNV